MMIIELFGDSEHFDLFDFRFTWPPIRSSQLRQSQQPDHQHHQRSKHQQPENLLFVQLQQKNLPN